MSWHRWRQIRSISWDSQQICLSNISMLHCRLEMWCTHIRGERFFQWKVNWRYNLTYLNDVDHMYNICNPHRFCTRASMGHAISWMQQLPGKFLVQNYLGQMTMMIGGSLSLIKAVHHILECPRKPHQRSMYCVPKYCFLLACNLLIETNWVDWPLCTKNVTQSKVLVGKMSAIQSIID